jgi:hypothetical protein
VTVMEATPLLSVGSGTTCRLKAASQICTLPGDDSIVQPEVDERCARKAYASKKIWRSLRESHFAESVPAKRIRSRERQYQARNVARS